MKRLLALCLVFSFVFALLCFGAVSAEEGQKRFYLDVRQNSDGTYAVDICWEGAELSDDIGALRLSMTYPSEQLVCISRRTGPALRDFSIRVGPQYVTSNPAVFLGVEINRGVTSEGALGSFVFEKAPNATGKAELKLEVLELYRRDNSDCRADFAVESNAIVFDAASPAPACAEDASIHENLPWNVEGDRLVRVCGHCGKTVSEKAAQQPTQNPVVSENATFTPGNGKLPQGAEVQVEENAKAPVNMMSPEEKTRAAEEKSGVSPLTLLSVWDVKLYHESEKLSLTEKGALTLKAPEGVGDGEALIVALFDETALFDVQRVSVKDGNVSFLVGDACTVCFFEGEVSADVPEAETGDGTQTPENTPGETPEEAEENGGLPVLFLVGVSAVLLFAVGAAVFLILKKKRSA